MSLRTVRVMTYNIRSARGSDGWIDLGRICDVIASFDPDLVALQEVDHGHARSGAVDQAGQIGRRLGLEVHFACTIERRGERCGNATLTRLPVLSSHRVVLPHRGRSMFSEPRCALFTRLRVAAGAAGTVARELDFVNTHLSTVRGEQPDQVAALAEALDTADLVVAGDLNCTARSPTYRALCRRLWAAARGARSWPALLPLVQIDHILYRGALEVVRAGTWITREARRASDHLPIVAEFALAG